MPGREYSCTQKAEHFSPLLSRGYAQALYQASIDVFGKHVSGLFLFKYDSIAQEHHIVLLSEVGLSLLEMKYSNGEFTVVDCKSFIEKEQVIKTLQQDIALLIREFSCSTVCNGAGQEKAFAYKGAKKAWYILDDGEHVSSVTSKISAFIPVNITATGYERSVPQSITISHKRINLTMELQLIKLKN